MKISQMRKEYIKESNTTCSTQEKNSQVRVKQNRKDMMTMG